MLSVGYRRPSRGSFSNGPAGHVLLVPQVLVGGQEDFKGRVLGHGQQVAVLQRVPVLLRGRAHCVADEKFANRDRGGLI